MKRSLLPIAVLFLALYPAALICQTNISFTGHLSYQQLHNSNISNLWGYTDETGNEYAIVGVNGSSNGPGGVSVVSLVDPTNPQEIFFVPGPPSIWREVKVWGDHAYVTTEANGGGVTIIDLSPLPGSTELNTTIFYGSDWTTSHSLFIDENGRMYIFGSSRGNGGAIMYDLVQNPMAPVEVGQYDNWYVHDGYARGDTLYAAHILNGFFTIVDVSNPAAPVLLGTQTTPDLFTHNLWLDDSGDHLFSTDERPNAYVGSYDVSDPTDITFEDKLRSDGGSGAPPHNTYWLNDFLVTSYYTYGVAIYDATRPHNLVEVGNYDTNALNGAGFDGAWGVYPFFNSQRLIVSDIEQGLFVLSPTYVRACWLEGTVTNSITGVPVGQVNVTIEGSGINDLSAVNGGYATGQLQPGTFTVTFTAAGYETLTVDGVALVTGELTVLDVQLVPLNTFMLQGNITDAISGDPIEGAQVVISNELYWFTSTSDASGYFQMPAIYEDEYEILAGRWGWVIHCPGIQTFDTTTEAVSIQLFPGYHDDMELNLGWTGTSSANSGIWTREIPAGTVFQAQQSAPGADVEGDCGEDAWVSGNGGGAAGDDDIDDGWIMLSSPLFDASQMIDPHITVQRWFFNAGGEGPPNDHLRLVLVNGIDSIVVQELAGPGLNSWQESDIRVLDHMLPTASMRFHAIATDAEPGHLVEAGIDLFRVLEMGTIGMEQLKHESGLVIHPNPSDGRFMVTLEDGGDALVELLDVMGRQLHAPMPLRQGRLQVDLDLSAGTYLLRISRTDGIAFVERLIVSQR